jgi:hypothetical protein
MGWATFWAIFPQTHLVTLVENVISLEPKTTFHFSGSRDN